MVKKDKDCVKEEENMILVKSISPQKSERVICRKTNKFANMSNEDMKEFNDVTKGTRGLSKITYKNVFGDGIK